MEHLVIRQPNYVAGTFERPEVRVFVETNTSRRPLDDNRLAEGQTVWMKWKDGPVVAKAAIDNWKSGAFTVSTISQIRDLCRGTNLYDLDTYWESVRRKGQGFFTVVRLRNEAWLDQPFYPRGRSYGTTWFYIDSPERQKDWLTPSAEAAAEAETDTRVSRSVNKRSRPGRERLPPSIRFAVLRRDSFTCRYCGRKAPAVALEVDHVVAYVEVCEHRMDNLVTACFDCNRGKGRTGL
jgi:hypothetical protein